MGKILIEESLMTDLVKYHLFDITDDEVLSERIKTALRGKMDRLQARSDYTQALRKETTHEARP